MDSLKVLFDKYECDKAKKHRYHEVYEPLFIPDRDQEINFLEVGVWKAASTKAFHDFFFNGNIYGVDIFTRIKINDIDLSKHPRIKLMQGDSMDFSVTGKVKKEFPVEFDYILDDGAHWPKANMLTFRHFHPLLKSGGLYIIEDVWPMELMTGKELKHPWLTKHPNRYNPIDNHSFLNELFKSDMTIERFDLRSKSGKPDSYIITLRKP